MTTRLITTFEEAKALKEAGWPQDFDAEKSEWFTDPDGLVVFAPRLDELLAFLWDRGYATNFYSMYVRHEDAWADNEGHTIHVQKLSSMPTPLTGEDFCRSAEPIVAVIGAVLHVLNSERSPE